MKNKDEFFRKFQEFKALVKYLKKRNIKVIRSDNGVEYTSNEFNDFYKESRIKREFNIPYNPQWNGVGERRNISIIEAVSTLSETVFLNYTILKANLSYPDFLLIFLKPVICFCFIFY